MPPTAQSRARTGADASRLPSLTGMRIIAAVMVFAFHANYQFPFTDKHAASTFNRIFALGGSTGVGFFFILSGFVLTWSARSTDTTVRFWRRRVVKIFPNHLITFLAAALIFINAGTALGGWKAVPSFFLLQAWFPQPDIASAMNPVAWSLSAELLFYLSFPFLVRAVNRVKPQHLWLWAAGVVGVIFTIPLIASTFPDGAHVVWGPVTKWQGWLVYMSPPVRMLEFIFGIFLARIVQTGRWIKLPLLPAAVIAVATYYFAWNASWMYNHVAVMVIPLGLLIAAGAQADIDGTFSPLRNRPMVWLGNVSFAFYLWHALVLTELSRHTHDLTTRHGIGGGLAYLGIGFAITLVLSGAMYTFVEEPAMRRWSRPKSARTAAAPSRIVARSVPAEAEAAADASAESEPVAGLVAAEPGPEQDVRTRP
ncbi:acyltransferase family protein [Kitasatospora sp. LaBMicrA B282]|uniref:acyltransferase family protein n=1 Tax=Kitasatospora sp. LaBMicrA B282 TaxID=3420949 RepID=UPI003D0B8F30